MPLPGVLDPATVNAAVAVIGTARHVAPFGAVAVAVAFVITYSGE